MSEFPKTVTMEVFRGGKQTDKSGNTKTWTEADLDKIISATQKVGESVPATVGHPSDNSPAWAWFPKQKFFRKGLSLFAEMGNIHQKFGQALRDKLFKNRSIALRKDYSIRHVAVLGGKMPAVKGLVDFAFDEGEEDFTEFEFEFGENEFTEGAIDSQVIFGLRTIARILRRFKNKQIEKDGVEKANEMIEEFELDSLSGIHNSSHEDKDSAPSFQEPDLNNQGHAPNNGGDDMDAIKELTDKIDGMGLKFAEMEKVNTTLTADLKTSNEAKDKFEKEFTEYKETQKKAEYSEWIGKMVDDGKIIPANKNAILSTLGALDGNEAQEFSEGDETKKVTPLDIFKKQIENGPNLIEFGEAFKDGKNRPTKDDSGDEMMKLIREREKEAKISFNEANQQIMDENPILVQKL